MSENHIPAGTNDPTPDSDAADQAAGYRYIIDTADAAQAPGTNPNIAASIGDHDHHNHIGEEVEDDHGVAAAGEALDQGEAA